MIVSLEHTDYRETADRVKSRIGGRPHYAYVITFGCQQNEADSEKIRRIAIDMGYLLTDEPSRADLIVMNTCAIREHAEMKAMSLLGTYKACRKANPDLLIGIAGCMAAEKKAALALKNDFHYVNFTVEPNMLHRIPSLVLNALDDGRRSFLLGEDRGDIVEGIGAVRQSDYRAWVSIMYGCNNFCTYCIVPYVRGRERSRDASAVLEECRSLVFSGVKEITLLGQNVNSYRSETDFPGLLEAIAGLDGDFIIRFMTSHPKDVSDRLCEVMGKYPDKIAPYFHLPLQSGSDRILKAMNRTYNREKFLDTVNRLRRAVPHIALSTDVIIGFPGETDGDFDDTMSILEEVRFDMAYSFLFSPREGTKAAKMDSPVPREAMDKRMAYLLDRQGQISYECNQSYVGKTLRVLTDRAEPMEGGFRIDGRTPENKLIHFTSENPAVGRFAGVTVERAGAFDLFGKEER